MVFVFTEMYFIIKRKYLISTSVIIVIEVMGSKGKGFGHMTEFQHEKSNNVFPMLTNMQILFVVLILLL